jgi:hypothetical protein
MYHWRLYLVPWPESAHPYGRVHLIQKEILLFL